MKDKAWDKWLESESMVCPVCAAGIFTDGFTNYMTAKLVHRSHHAQLNKMRFIIKHIAGLFYRRRTPPPNRWLP